MRGGRERPGRGTPDDSFGHGWLGVPPTPRPHVARERLLDRLDESEGHPLVLVSAPAGSGKTCLVAHWVTTRATERSAWITFDESDTGFWPGLGGCLEELGVPVAEAALPSDDAALDPGVRRRIAAALAAERAPVTVVVDGYELGSASLAADLDYVLRRSGHRLRLVLLTRADPVLPLYRYRLDESLIEVRMADLAFDDAETAQLMDLMGVHLEPKAVRALNRRTRGWVTGLRFTASVLGEHEDPGTALDELTGHAGNIGEYLMGEVLAAHPPQLREVLMATSVPDVVRPGLAEALAGRSAARTLASLTRVNAFIEQVPGRVGFYRYHPLFRELLRAELAYTEPETMALLQRRAAQWFAGEGMLAPAVHHYVSAGAWQEAARSVVEGLAVGRLLLDEPSEPLVRTLRRMPLDLDDPAALVVRATLALRDGDTERFDQLLAGHEPRPDDPASEQAVPLAVAVLQALRARSSDDPDEAEGLALVAEDALARPDVRRRPETPPELAALVLDSKALALVRLGRLAEAKVAGEAGARAALDADCAPLRVACLGHLALLACCAGDVDHARALAARALEAGDAAGAPDSDRSAAAQVALAWVAVEQYDLRRAVQRVRLAEQCDSALDDPVSRCLLTLVKSRLQVAHGDRSGALANLDAAQDGPDMHSPGLADRLRVEASWLRVTAGQPDAALAGLTGVDPRTVPEAALVLLVAHLLHEDDAAADEALARVLDRGTPPPIRVGGWLAECARRLRRGSTAQAGQALDKALRLAAGPCLRRPLHEAPAPVRQLLLQEPLLSAQHAWLFDVPGMAAPTAPRSRRLEVADAGHGPPLPVTALTGKEMEVLGHLAQMLTTDEIAAVMYVSVNTVRTHVRNILRKLGVNRRNSAVRLARELEILSG